MKAMTAIFFAALALLLSSSSSRAGESLTVFYQSGDSIYGINELSDETFLIASGIPQTVTFSNSGHYAAYHDSQGVWISQTNNWTPELVISNLPRESFSLIWTPDDTRLILRLAFWPEDADPSEQPLAYNLLTKSDEPWIWGVCDQIAQHRILKDFALVCQATEDTPSQPISAIALGWGGEFHEYNSQQYEILRSDLLDFFPPPFNWGVVESNQNMVYMMENPNYQLDTDGYSFWQIASRWSNGDILTVDSSQESDIELWFAVSLNRSMVAYSVFCGNPTGSCLQIADIKTGEVKWSNQQTIQVDRIYDIVWYPDNRRVALLGTNADENSNHHDILYIFDVENGTRIRFDVGTTSGTIAIA